MQVVLSLFPGADLFGRAFEAEGFCVVRGPDVLWGGDVRNFHIPPGRFDGIIGGPPCQKFSSAALTGSDGENLIPEFVRLIEEGQPCWAVMENVRGAFPAAPAWPHATIRDWDCGGLTARIRPFWFYGIPPCPLPPRRGGKPAYSILATNYKCRPGNQKGKTKRVSNPFVSPEDAARLQGFPGLDLAIMDAQPDDVSATARRCLAIHMLGNGVPEAMGRWIAVTSSTSRKLDELRSRLLGPYLR